MDLQSASVAIYLYTHAAGKLMTTANSLEVVITSKAQTTCKMTIN